MTSPIRAIRRDTPSDGIRRPRVRHGMNQIIGWDYPSGTAVASWPSSLQPIGTSSIGVAAGMALSVLFLVPSALLVVLLVAAGLWCRGNSLDARDLSVWSMGGTPAEEGGEWK